MDSIASLHQDLALHLQKSGCTSFSDPKFAQFMDTNDPLAHTRAEFSIPKEVDIKATAVNPKAVDTTPIPGTTIANGHIHLLIALLRGNQAKLTAELCTFLEPGSIAPTEVDCVYLTGNSLGLPAKKAAEYVNMEMEKWQRVGVMGHEAGKNEWLTIDEEATQLSAKLFGAKESEVAIMTTLTTNLNLLLVPFYKPTADRFKILIEAGAFPSDLYCAESQALVHGYNPSEAVVRIAPREGERLLREEDIIKTIESHKFAVLMLPGVHYETGQLFDMKKIAEVGHKSGAYVGFDLAHGVGNVELKLNEWDIDFAAWCSYKYLNGGPGGIGGLFFHEKHHRNPNLHKFSGWWGHNLSTRFRMKEEFDPIAGAFAFRLSNPAVLPIVSLLATLQIMDRVGNQAMLTKQRLLTGYLETLLRSELGDSIVSIVTPADPLQRGCQLSLDFRRSAKELEHQLFLHGIVTDARDTIIRAAPTPLYNSFSDVQRFVQVLKSILKSE